MGEELITIRVYKTEVENKALYKMVGRTQNGMQIHCKVTGTKSYGDVVHR